jgi:2-C-methyl-D-erythritol 2,4-cyclodiphosphate synthase
VLGGVKFDHPTGPVSHSDGDAVYHAVTDAILGAISQPDIGEVFSDSDPKHESADSSIFMRDAVARIDELNFALCNADVTVICESPKIGPCKAEMISNLARLLGVDDWQVNVKGKTHEKVDAVGEGRAMEVHAIVLLMRRPPTP